MERILTFVFYSVGALPTKNFDTMTDKVFILIISFLTLFAFTPFLINEINYWRNDRNK